MAKDPPSSGLDSVWAGAPDDETEITPAMVEAGVTALAGCHYPHADPDSWEDQAIAVYRAMTACRLATLATVELRGGSKNTEIRPFLNK
jgi:hypothetical protein